MNIARHRLLAWRCAGVGALMLIRLPLPAHAGAPFVTDDPGTTPPGDFEIDLAATHGRLRGETSGACRASKSTTARAARCNSMPSPRWPTRGRTAGPSISATATPSLAPSCASSRRTTRACVRRRRCFPWWRRRRAMRARGSGPAAPARLCRSGSASPLPAGTSSAAAGIGSIAGPVTRTGGCFAWQRRGR